MVTEKSIETNCAEYGAIDGDEGDLNRLRQMPQAAHVLLYERVLIVPHLDSYTWTDTLEHWFPTFLPSQILLGAANCS